MNAFLLSATLPRDARFREFVAACAKLDDVTELEAATFIRYACDIESRRELETNQDAERRFHEIVRRSFVAWRDGRLSLQ